MRERLKIDPQADGALWYYHFAAGIRSSHRHSELELNLVTRGRACYLFGERRIDLQAGTLIWMFPAQEHLLVEESRDFAMWIAVFKPGMVRRACTAEFTAILRKNNPHDILSRQLPAAQAKQLTQLCSDMCADRRRDLLNAGLPWLLLHAWELHRMSPSDDGDLPRRVHPAVAKAARLIRDEIDVPKIDDLAEQCGLSPSRLSRLFKQQTGVSLVGYRQRQCLDRFFRIWNDEQEGGEQNLLIACLSAGFGSYAQFFRVCKELTGLTPRQLHDRRGHFL